MMGAPPVHAREALSAPSPPPPPPVPLKDPGTACTRTHPPAPSPGAVVEGPTHPPLPLAVPATSGESRRRPSPTLPTRVRAPGGGPRRAAGATRRVSRPKGPCTVRYARPLLPPAQGRTRGRLRACCLVTHRRRCRLAGAVTRFGGQPMRHTGTSINILFAKQLTDTLKMKRPTPAGHRTVHRLPVCDRKRGLGERRRPHLVAARQSRRRLLQYQGQVAVPAGGMGVGGGGRVPPRPVRTPNQRPLL